MYSKYKYLEFILYVGHWARVIDYSYQRRNLCLNDYGTGESASKSRTPQHKALEKAVWCFDCQSSQTHPSTPLLGEGSPRRIPTIKKVA